MMQFENPIQANYSAPGTGMTSTPSYVNHQPTPFYIDNILAPTPTASEETDASATSGAANGLSNEQDHNGLVALASASQDIAIENKKQRLFLHSVLLQILQCFGGRYWNEITVWNLLRRP